ncbi:Gfo/Idh/MocA family protein [Leifsonia poae]|uniref:Gfo/Idh/MocA family protein n=1 Tax=Leifsonia poae TaxID=110933 RepID=UPI001CBD5133|nr:Gfo/Idh/MocA family oxidoreductase [Leifsonia poae]
MAAITRIGVIGLGTIATEHLKAYQRCADAEVVAVCDLDRDRAEAARTRFGVEHSCGTAAELLADPDIDAVSVCVPNDQHAPIALAALAAGKHVLVEKPMAITVADAEALVAASRESGKVLQVGYVRRFSPNALLLKRFIDAGDLGEIYLAKASLLRAAGNPGGWFSDRSVSGGGPLIDLGVHLIDLCWWLMGAPRAVTVSGSTFSRLGARHNIDRPSRYRAATANPPATTVEDYAGAHVRFANGAALFVDTSYSLHGRDETSVRLYGDRGGAELEPELTLITEQNDTVLHVHPQLESTTFDLDTAFANEVAHFVAAARGEAAPEATAEHGLELTRILAAIYESAQQGHEIPLTR